MFQGHLKSTFSAGVIGVLWLISYGFIFSGTGGVEIIDKNGYYPYMKSLVDGIAAIPGYEKGVSQ